MLQYLEKQNISPVLNENLSQRLSTPANEPSAVLAATSTVTGLTLAKKPSVVSAAVVTGIPSLKMIKQRNPLMTMAERNKIYDKTRTRKFLETMKSNFLWSKLNSGKNIL